MRLITARYSSICPLCKESISVGDSVYWAKGKKAIHKTCRDSMPPSESPKLHAATNDGNRSRFVIDWSELKSIVNGSIVDHRSPKMRGYNTSIFADSILNPSERFNGFSSGQLQRWLKEGFQTEGIHGISEFMPPIREKRKLQFVEEGDEFHLDMAYSGDDNFMSEWTKRDAIPGMRIDVSVGFSGGIKPEVPNAYITWVCKVLYSLDSVGVDCELNVGQITNNLFRGNSQVADTMIRVKKENEKTDFLSWSAMLSPGGYRGLIFAALALHAESKNVEISPGLGMVPTHSWEVRFNEAENKIEMQNDFSSSRFPEEEMTRQFQAALRVLQKKPILAN